jgi:iron complex outermembrane receptor protein
MKRIFTLLLFLGVAFYATGQKATLSGKITDDSGTALIGANIMAEGNSAGTVTDLDGNYELMLDPGTYTILVSYIGFRDQRQEVTLAANEKATLSFTLNIGNDLDMVVISGSRRPEKLTESAATIETIFAREIEQFAGSPAELVARQKGVEYFRAGIAAPAFNIRGFNSNFNSKNLQVTDSRFSSLVATGLPLGPLNTTIKEDIERVEIILGPNSTLYGPNAHNGLLNIITKDPRTSAGTTVALNGGVNGDGNGLYSARLRHAQVVNDKFAFKVMGEYSKATEFDWADSIYIDRLDADGDLIGTANYDGADGIKEGWEELELNPDVDFTRLEGALYYTPKEDLDIILNTGYSNSNYLSPTNVGRNQIVDWQIFYTQLRINYKNFFVQSVYTQSQTDDTYSIDDRTKAYYTGIDVLGLSDEEARGAQSYSTGARFKDASNRWNSEIQYNNKFGNLEMIAGAQWQQDRANSLGTYLIENDLNEYYNGEYIVVNQYGGYAHFTYDFNRGWRALAAARADYHDVYEFNFVPKLGLLKIGDKGTWRLTYGQGIAAPTILNMFGNLFNGLILGNAEGFDLVDGTRLEAQRVEKLQTFELGYRGQLKANKLFIDANAYYNISEDFLSPVTTFFATARGKTPLREVQADALYDLYAGIGLEGLVATYVNFGQVNTYGFDLNMNYYFTPEFNAYINYSYFDYTFDETDLTNDFDRNGTVNFLDILVNAPNNRFGLGMNYNGNKFYGGAYGRFAESYNYFSSFQIASETVTNDEGNPLTWRGTPIVEDARGTDSYNYGPLGGFFTLDVNVGYHVTDNFRVNLSAVNLFNEELREFTAAAPTRGIYTMELVYNFPAL